MSDHNFFVDSDGVRKPRRVTYWTGAHYDVRAMEAGWADGVQDSMLRATQYERILQDLIAELRDGHRARSELVWAVPLWAVQAIDRAEARLRGVSPEFPEGATVADVSMSLSKGHGDE